MSGNSTRWAIAVVASLLVLLALPVLSAPAAAAPATPMAPSASVSAASQWAYGGQQWTNVTVTTNNVTYQLSAYFGWAVVFTQTNTSATTVMLEAQRTMGAHLDASLCAPNCQNPVLNGSVHMKGYEQQTAFANFTLLGTVYVNGSATAALGLINTSAYVRGALNESYFVTLTNHTFSATASAALHVTEHASASVAFTPALGLVPFNLTRGETWNSSASYVASGLWAAAFSWTKTSFLGVTTTGSGNPSGTANATGTLQLYGQDFGTVTLKNGQTVPVIGIAIVGPFDDLDGFILVPHGSGIFAAAVHAWDGSSVGAQTVTTAKVDVDTHARGHLGFTAASSVYSGTMTAVSGSVTLASGITVASAPAVGTSPTEVQAQPESVPTAQQQSNCFVVDCSSALGHGGLGALVVVGLIGLVVAAAVGAAYMIGGRRGPQAPRPSVTVPAGAQGTMANTPGRPTPNRPAPPNAPAPAEDPLRHLW